ncbi:TIGR01777 family protein [bacterium]|nr:TIGR01777 family protein [bacterium]
MKIVIAGGTGFIGSYLEKEFTRRGDRVFILTRKPEFENHIYWDAKTPGKWVEILENSDVLINLTGKSVDCRYTRRNKELIINSRVDSTKILGKALRSLNHPPKLWINSSTATIYKSNYNEPWNEQGEKGDDFSMGVAKAWEEAFFSEKTGLIRKVALRIAIVLGEEGGAFPKLVSLSKLGLGGKQGTGKQKVSFVHIKDVYRAILFLIKDKALSGVFNLSSPFPVTNEYLMKELRAFTGSPIAINSPAWLLEIASFFMRTESELVLKSRNVVPERLINEGFQFKYPQLSSLIQSFNPSAVK